MRKWFRALIAPGGREATEGESLQALIELRREYPLRRKLEIVAEVADALQQVHREGLRHGDVKPANILLTNEGAVKLADLRTSRIEPGSGFLVGTIAYMAPEQVRGDQIDSRCDIWALGVTLYEWLALARPFAGDTIAATMFNIVSQEPAPLSEFWPDAPAELQAIITKALKKNVEERYQTAEELARDLRALAANLPPN